MIETSSFSDFLAFHHADLQGKLFPTEVKVHENIDAPYLIQAHLISNSHDIPIQQLLSKSATITININETRSFQGTIVHVEADNIDYLGHRAYYIEMMPWFGLLDHIKVNRFYYNISIPRLAQRIVRDVCQQDLNIEHLVKRYEAQDCIIQYQESYLAFLQRILAQAGIFYRFELGQLVESIQLRDWPISTSERYIVGDKDSSNAMLYDWQETVSLQADTIATHFSSALFSPYILQKQKKVYQPSYYKFAQVINSQGIDSNAAAIDILDYQKKRAQLENAKIQFKSHHPTFSPGRSIWITHPRQPETTGSYMTLSVKHHVWDHSYYKKHKLRPARGSFKSETQHYQNQVTVLSNQLDFVPKRKSSPQIKSMTSATVIATHDQTVYTNKFGAIKIKFPWQAEDNVDLCYLPWTRVLQWQAGNRWGSQFIPRAGDEVLVSFLQGNLLKSIVMGQVYNQQNKIPEEQSDNRAITKIRSQIFGQSVGHELILDDTKNQEVMRWHAQGDYIEKVKNDTNIQIKGDDILHVNGQSLIQVLSGKSDIKAQRIKLQVGTNKLEISDSGINIKGETITFKAKGVGGNYPVARFGDNHSCNKMTAGVAHQGGTISSGSALLKINQLAAACLDDTANCISATDVINQGVDSITVQGKPLSRVGHTTAHGGTITAGSPNVFVDEISV